MKHASAAFYVDQERVRSDIEYLNYFIKSSQWKELPIKERSNIIHHVQLLTELSGVLAEAEALRTSK